MGTPQIKRNDKRIKRKQKNKGINKRKATLVKKAYELGDFNSINVALIIYKHGRYTIYRSKDCKIWPLFIAEIISGYSPNIWYNILNK
jgi:hypothetical protein